MALEDKSLEELEAMMSGKAPLPDAAPEPPPLPPPPAPESEKAAEAVPPDKPPEPETAKGDEPLPLSQEDLRSAIEDANERAEQADLRAQKIEAILERQKFIASREAGRAGFFEDKVKARAESRREPDEEIEGDEPEPDERPERPARPRPRRDDGEIGEIRAELEQIRAERAMNVMKEEAGAFFLRRPDARDDGIREKLLEKLAPLQEEHEEALFGRDLKLARATAKSLFGQAYADVKLEAIEAKRTRRAEQFASARKTKIEDTASATGASPTPRKVEKPLAEKSIEELDQMLKEMSRK